MPESNASLVRQGFSARVVPPSGVGTSHILMCGEAPGEWEDRHLLPFHPQAPAGSVFERLVKRAGYSRESFKLTNVVWQRPPNNFLEHAPYEGEAIDAWRPFNDQLIDEMRPKVIITLGNVALKALTQFGHTGTTVTHLSGYVLEGPHGAWIIPTLHPSYILQGQQALSGVLIWAFQRAHQIVREGFSRKPVRYVISTSLDDAEAFVRGYNPERHSLSYDIETPESPDLDEEQVEEQAEDVSYNIRRISFCYDADTGYAVSWPWQTPFIELSKRLLGSIGPKRVWNGNFDNPRLKAAGVQINGRNYDCMWGWKHLQPTLPRSLGFVTPFFGWTQEPWKYRSSSEPEYYSAADAHALQLCGDGIERSLRVKGQWDRYEKHTVDVLEILGQMSRNGLPYDKERAIAFEKELQAKWDERFNELQVRVPDSLKPQKQKHGLKKLPKDYTGLIQREFEILASEATDEERVSHSLDLVDDFMMIKVTRWCKLEPFLPTSWQQLLRLIKHYGQKPGTNRKTKKETTEDDSLRKLIKKCVDSKKESEREFAQLLKMCRECRQLSKVLGTYVKGWRPGVDGRIHATPGFWGKMFRISWRRPNIAATIADKQEEYIAAGFRKCVAAPIGRVLVEADWKGIEAVLVGWFAGDPDYMRLAKIGVHDYFCSHVLVSKKKLLASDLPSLAWSDSDLAVYFKSIKKRFPKDRDDSKHIVHGTAYGMREHLMSDLYEMSLGEAKRLQAFYFQLFPKIKEWQNSVILQADREAKLTNPFGYSMPFWEVRRWNSRYQRWELGEDAKSAISFLPRDTAAAMLKEALLRLRYLAEDRTMLSSTHDSILTEVSESSVDSMARLLKFEMERPVPELNGLVINVDVKAGPAWDEEGMSGYDFTKETVLATADPAHA